LQQSGQGFFYFTMANETYADKLKNPAWQKKRLEILNRDNFTCLVCRDTETELHIHHKQYKTGRKPWDYENENFQTLCKCCHLITEIFKDCGLTPLIASKLRNDKCSYTLVSTILSHPTEGLILTLDRFYDNGEVKHLIMIDQQPFGQIHDLFAHAEKLLK